MRWTARLRDDDRGSALIEGAVLMPFLCALFFGVFEFSFYFYQQHLMSTGVADAARYIARSCNPNDATVQANAKNIATMGMTSGGTNRVAGWDPAEVTVAIVPNVDPGTAYRGSHTVVTVTGSFPYATLGFWGFFGFSTPAVQVVHSERYVGGTLGC
jgi:Flp pilus assembly protein TadG